MCQCEGNGGGPDGGERHRMGGLVQRGPLRGGADGGGRGGAQRCSWQTRTDAAPEGGLGAADDGGGFGGAARLVYRNCRPLVLARSSIRKLFGCGGIGGIIELIKLNII
jgi:hypothetical protein